MVKSSFGYALSAFIVYSVYQLLSGRFFLGYNIAISTVMFLGMLPVLWYERRKKRKKEEWLEAKWAERVKRGDVSKERWRRRRKAKRK